MKAILIGFILLFIDLCVFAETVIKVSCECKSSDVQLSYISDPVVYKNVVLKPVQDSSGLLLFRFNISKPILASLAREWFLIFPGDSVNVIITGQKDDRQFQFQGKNSENYSFFLALKEIPKFNLQAWQFTDYSELSKFRNQAREHYLSTLTILESYIARNHTADNFNQIARSLLITAYANNLIYPINLGNLSKENLPPGYLSDIDYQFLNQPELMIFRDYVLVLTYFNKFYSDLHHSNFYDSTFVRSRLESIRKNFALTIQNDLLLLTFDNIVLNGPANLSNIVQELNNELLLAFKGNQYRIEQINQLFKRFQVLGKKLPNEVLDLPLTTVEGKTIMLRQIIDKSDKTLYVDFWASWCEPCMHEMPASERLYKKTDTLATFVYISIDKDEAKWMRALKKIAVSGQHYQLSNEFKSPLTRYIGFNTIPRYLIISADGTLRDYDAPRPSEAGKLIQIFKSLQSN